MPPAQPVTISNVLLFVPSTRPALIACAALALASLMVASAAGQEGTLQNLRDDVRRAAGRAAQSRLVPGSSSTLGQ